MATDRLGNTISAGQVYLLAGAVRRVDDDEVLVVLGDGRQLAVRVKANEVIPVDSAGVPGGGPVNLPTTDMYEVNDVLDGDPLYVGKAKSDGTWLLQRYSDASGEMRWANASNNAGVTTYADAWTGRASLTYGRFETLTGL